MTRPADMSYDEITQRLAHLAVRHPRRARELADLRKRVRALEIEYGQQLIEDRQLRDELQRRKA